MAQRIRRLTSNQKNGGSNPSVVDILFYTKEISLKGCQNKGCQYKRDNTSTEQVRQLTGHAWPHGPTDKASDFESEEWGFESLCGRLFLHKGNFLEIESIQGITLGN